MCSRINMHSGCTPSAASALAQAPRKWLAPLSPCPSHPCCAPYTALSQHTCMHARNSWIGPARHKIFFCAGQSFLLKTGRSISDMPTCALEHGGFAGSKAIVALDVGFPEVGLLDPHLPRQRHHVRLLTPPREHLRMQTAPDSILSMPLASSHMTAAGQQCDHTRRPCW